MKELSEGRVHTSPTSDLGWSQRKWPLIVDILPPRRLMCKWQGQHSEMQYCWQKVDIKSAYRNIPVHPDDGHDVGGYPFHGYDSPIWTTVSPEDRHFWCCWWSNSQNGYWGLVHDYSAGLAPSSQWYWDKTLLWPHAHTPFHWWNHFLMAWEERITATFPDFTGAWDPQMQSTK